MQSVNVWILIVAITVSLFQGGTTYEIVGDLSALQDQYQTLLTEYESSDSAHDTGIATLLEKLDILQYSIPSHPNNVTLEWFTPPIDSLSNPPLRITIVVSSFEGMFLNSGIGTFYSSLTDFLISAGHAVTILYTDTQASDTPAFAKWSAQLARRGAKAARLGAFPIHLRLSTLAQRSYQVYEYLKGRQTEFDAVHFPDWEGPGYYSMLAKKDGLAFLNKVFIVGIHGPWRWVKAANHPNSRISSSLQTAEDMETDWMERKSVEMSDMVWTPSSDIISWLKQQGWAIPLPIYQMPYLPGREIAQIKINFKDVEVDESESINELVFFGRLETRKGVELFADALDRLAVTRPEFAGTKITFLGRSANIGNQTASSYINDRYVKGAWPFKLVFVSHKDRKAALEYLRESSRIAVIPSLVDNTPYTVYECLFANIPFIASNISSIAALVDPADRDDALFEVSSISLARKLENVLDNGARAIKSTLLLSQIEAAWAGFYAAAYNKITEQKAQKPVENTLEPLVSVCIIHYNRPQFLQLALESVEAQTYTNFEVVLVDDGSTTQAAREYLETLAPKFAIKGWQLILSTNQYLGAARNKAAAHARGEYLLFLDDDNLLSPTLLSTYIAVAARTRADVLTAGHDVFEGNGKVDMNANVVGRWVPLGASPLVGLFKNCFGDANFFIKKTVFDELNGFTEDRGVGQEDHEFLAKAVLDGFSLLVIPEPLLAYRMHNQSEQMLYTTDSLKNALRAHRPYRRLMEESGIEINEKGLTTTPQKPTHNAESLKLLAYSRAYSRQTSSSCNLTVTSVTPATIQARTSVTLTFTTSARDCEISNLRLGDQYICDLVGVAAFSFSCVTQPIPIPGNYPVYLQYTVEPNYRDTLTRVSVLASPNPDGATSAVFTLAVLREAGQFAQDELLDRVSTQTPGAPISSYSMLARTTTSVGAKRAVDGDELHTTTIMVTNLKPTAAQAYQTLGSAINANRSCLLPYRFSSLQLNAICNSQGVCSCSPYFTGPGCTTPATCPNDCSGHGSCTNGPNGKLCQCDAGWLGTDCSVGTCPNNCNGHGTCNVERGAGNATCVCNLGWEGAACDEPNCPGNCNGNACQNKICICPAGVTTPDCSILGEGETDGGSGRIVNPTAAGDDTYDRDVFIGILFMFLVLIVVAGAFVYHAHQRKKSLQQQDDD